MADINLDAILQKIGDTRFQLLTAEQHLKEGLKAVQTGLKTLESCERNATNAIVDALPVSAIQPTLHRREHRMGRAPKLDTDAEVRAFVVARFDRMTFQQIADDIKANFPKERWIGTSSIHRWWSNHYGSSGT